MTRGEEAFLFQLKSVSKAYHPETVVLRDIDLEIRPGEVLGIIGLSGAGKSTLLRLFNALERPSSGEVYVHGRALSQLSSSELDVQRRKMGMVFQGFALLQQKTVLENVIFPLRIAGVSVQEARRRGLKLLEWVGMSDRAEAYPAHLSGGQQQRVGIARALAGEPDVLLCDEVTSALDSENTEAIIALLRTIHERLGTTLILITHELSIVQALAERVIVLDQGCIVEDQKVDLFFQSPQSERAKALLSSLKVESRSFLKDCSVCPELCAVSGPFIDQTQGVLNGAGDLKGELQLALRVEQEVC